MASAEALTSLDSPHKEQLSGHLYNLARTNLGQALRRRGFANASEVLRVHATANFIQPGWIKYALDTQVEPDDHDSLLAGIACAEVNVGVDGSPQDGIVYAGERTIARVVWYLSMIHDPSAADRAARVVGAALGDRAHSPRWGGDASKWTQDDRDRHADFEREYQADMVAFNSLWPYAHNTGQERDHNAVVLGLGGAGRYLKEFESIRAIENDLDSVYTHTKEDDKA